MSKEVQELNSPFAPNGVKHEPEKFTVTDYESIEILDQVVKTGDGPHDFIVEKVVNFSYQPIKDVVAVDADKVGVYAVLKQFMKTGDQTLIPRDEGKCHVDLVGAPSSLMEVEAMGKDAEKKFQGLPDGLKGDMDLAKFVETMSQEKFDAFVKALADRSSKKSEVKENGE